MNPEIARKLADELESGRWEKAKGQLGRAGCSRCCLGVLQEIAPEHLERSRLPDSLPSVEVMEWAAMTQDEAVELAAFNDEVKGWARVAAFLRGIK